MTRFERVFLVTSLHEQRSNPLGAAEWKLCTKAHEQELDSRLRGNDERKRQ
jgi:hypothetical protein